MKKPVRALGVVLLALSASLSPSPAAAQPAPSAQPTASASSAQPAASAQPSDDWKRQAARELANKGYEYYEAGKYELAVQFFRDAEARFHAPTLLLIQAKAQMKIGGLVEACDLYKRITSEKLAGDAPKEFLDAQVEADKGIDLSCPRVATLKLTLKGMVPEKVRVTIDDVEIPTDKVLQPIPQNPGPHRIVATLGGDEGGRAVFQQVTLKEGTTKQVQLVFRAGDPMAAAPSGGGCASCEIGAPRGSGEGATAAIGAAAASLLAALRRRRRGSRSRRPAM